MSIFMEPRICWLPGLIDDFNNGLGFGGDIAAVIDLRKTHHGQETRGADQLIDGDGSAADIGKGFGGSGGAG